MLNAPPLIRPARLPELPSHISGEREAKGERLILRDLEAIDGGEAKLRLLGSEGRVKPQEREQGSDSHERGEER